MSENDQSESVKSYTVVSIECGLGIVPPDLHCPRTGKPVFSEEADVEQPDSPFVTFIHHNECGFLFLREDIQRAFDEAREAIAAANPDEYETADDVDQDLESLLEHVDIGNVPLIYEVSSKDMACGPVTTTVHIGFDLWTFEEEEGMEEGDGDDEVEGSEEE